MLSDIDFFLALHRRDDKEHSWLEKWSTAIQEEIANEKDVQSRKEMMKRNKEEIEEEKRREQKIYEDWLKYDQ